MEALSQPTPETSANHLPEPLTAAQVYEKLGELLRATPSAGEKPFYVVGNDFSFQAWQLEVSKDSANADVIWLDTDVPE